MLNKFFFVNHKLFYFIVFSFLIHLIAAYFSQGFYEQDEHFSILEPVFFKLGENATLGWDFFYLYDKQWFLSFIFFYIIQLLKIIGINDPFQWAFIIRLSTSLLGWISIICLIHFTIKQLTNEKSLNALIIISSLFWFYPYIHARTSSENVSISFLIIAITLFTFFYKNKKILFLCGIFFGLAFVTRYTNIILIASLGIWAIVFRKTNFINSSIILISFFSVFIISVLIDYWGYQIFFPPDQKLVVLNYFSLNQKWVEMDYFNTNTNAWWYNFYFIFKEFLPPISIIIILSILVFWIRYPKNVITWTTLPYFVFLCTMPHKETRFLFPILMLSPFFIIMAFNNILIKGQDLINYILTYKITKVLIYFLVFINCIVLLILSITPANNATHLYQFLYNNEYEIKKIYTLDKIPYRKSDLLVNFYRNKNIYFTKITDVEECNKIGNEILIANEVNFNNYNEEKVVSEIQKYSYPKWIFEYSIQCNKETFFDNFEIKNKQYFLIHKFKFYDYFYNNQEYSCKRIYSTLPSFLIDSRIKNIFKNLSTWHIFECN